MRKLWIISLAILIGASLLTGCAKRKNPVISTKISGMYFTSSSLFAYPFNSALAGNKLGITDVSGKTKIGTYLPPGHPAIPGNPTSFQKYPVLYLLADFDQTPELFDSYYQLQALADQLLAAGEIDSLVIVVITADMRTATANLGGTFYANNFLIGDWLTYIGKEIIPWIDTTYIQYRIDPTRKAIAGLGMGGYGAFRLALEYDTLFDVVGAMSAPLAFGGTETSGWLNSFLLPQVMNENGNNFNSIKIVDPFNASKPVSSWMFAMSTAFSPRTDTTDKSGVTYRSIPGTNYGVDIPFDNNPSLVPFVVAEWMNWDIENLLNTAYTGALSGKKVYLDCGDADDFDFQMMNRRFDTFLTGKGVTHVYHEYSGYPGHDATHTIFTYDRLKELLKYISANM